MQVLMKSIESNKFFELEIRNNHTKKKRIAKRRHPHAASKRPKCARLGDLWVQVDSPRCRPQNQGIKQSGGDPRRFMAPNQVQAFTLVSHKARNHQNLPKFTHSIFRTSHHRNTHVTTPHNVVKMVGLALYPRTILHVQEYTPTTTKSNLSKLPVELGYRRTRTTFRATSPARFLPPPPSSGEVVKRAHSSREEESCEAQ